MSIILSAYVSLFAEKLLAIAKEEIDLQMGLGDVIERFRARLDRMLPVLADADIRRADADIRRLQDDAIQRWAQQLADIVYAAEDIIEGYRIEGQKRRRIGNQTSTSSSSSWLNCCYYPLISSIICIANRHKIGNKIEDLNQKLDDISKDIPILKLRSTLADHSLSRKISRKVSCVVQPDLVGKVIDDDTKMLVDLLLSTENQRQRKITVFSILGMAGIGKTTLAQKIFNDEKLKANFTQIKPVWVCVSHDFSDTDLLRAIIARAGGSPGESKDREDLEPMLHGLVRDKKFFLVLDDVWDARVWEELLYKPLQSASAGSRVVVTTRDESVARRMRAVHFHRVQKLSIEDGWSLLSNMVFQNVNEVEATQDPLKDVGMRIVKRCDGLPLAIKAIAGVLRNKATRLRDWEDVLRNPAWTSTGHLDGIMGALYLSYADMPSHLKQCFLYFAIFPEDAELRRPRVIRLWIAEGFVEARDNMQMEEVGKEYWRELVHRSLLDPYGGYYDLGRCKMHDLFHSLARYLARDECFSQDPITFEDRAVSPLTLSGKPRRVNIRNGEAIPEVIRRQASLRTLFLPFHKSFPRDATRKLRYLRILSISNSSIEQLPESIGDLVLLRYLDISGSDTREIPETIGNLVNLRFLIASGCKNLRNLPRSITNLQNLRCLDLAGTGIRTLPDRIDNLQNLSLLYGFWVSNMKIGYSKPIASYCNIGELGRLSQLHSLSVHNLDSVLDRIVARAAALRDKNSLVYLELHCTKHSSNVNQLPHYGQEEIEKISTIFEELCPPPCIEFLKIGGFFGLKHPSWMEMPFSFLPHLRRLELRDCVLCEHLPPLGLLPQLDCLWIDGAPSVKSIGPELFGVCSGSRNASAPRSSFPKLEVLHLENMPEWEEWNWLSEEDDLVTALLPSLDTLAIIGCPKLRSLPESLLRRATSLKCLWIEGAQSLTEIKSIPHVEDLTLICCTGMERISNLSALRKLKIEDFKSLTDVKSLDALQVLDLKDSGMESLPEWLLTEGEQELQFGALRRSTIEGNAQLLSRCLIDGPDWHKVRQIPSVDAYRCDARTYYIRYTKSPFFFDTNLCQ